MLQDKVNDTITKWIIVVLGEFFSSHFDILFAKDLAWNKVLSDNFSVIMFLFALVRFFGSGLFQDQEVSFTPNCPELQQDKKIANTKGK